jgi:hypothetical protein
MRDENTLVSEIWLNGVNQPAVLTLQQNSGDFICTTLSIHESSGAWSRYNLEKNESGFAQWVYLAIPSSYAAAIASTSLELEPLSFVTKQKAYFDNSRLVLDITVWYLMASCCANGIQRTLRRFVLVFVYSGPLT